MAIIPSTYNIFRRRKRISIELSPKEKEKQNRERYSDWSGFVQNGRRLETKKPLKEDVRQTSSRSFTFTFPAEHLVREIDSIVYQ